MDPADGKINVGRPGRVRDLHEVAPLEDSDRGVCRPFVAAVRLHRCKAFGEACSRRSLPKETASAPVQAPWPSWSELMIRDAESRQSALAGSWIRWSQELVAAPPAWMGLASLGCCHGPRLYTEPSPHTVRQWPRPPVCFQLEALRLQYKQLWVLDAECRA